MVKMDRKQKRIFYTGLSLILLFVMMSGCSSGSKYREGSLMSRLMGQRIKKTSPLYYDFGDVLVPGELKVDKSASFVYRTPGFVAGVISFKGRVDSNSLIAFFDSNMPKDGWRQVSSFRSPRTIMLFQKETRWCVIIISEEFTTRAEVWVAPMTPAVPDIEEGLLR